MAAWDSNAQHTLAFEDLDENCTNHETEVILEARKVFLGLFQRFSEADWAKFLLDYFFRAESWRPSVVLFCSAA